MSGDLQAQNLVIDGDKPFYIPTAFTADNVNFTKSGNQHQALKLPFNITEGYVGVLEGNRLVKEAETAAAGKPVVVNGTINLTAKNTEVAAGTWASSTGGFVLNAEGTEVVAAEGEVSPFTYVWESAFVVDATSINSVLENDKNGKTTVYDLQGRRTTHITQPGIYIVNGRKTLIK